MLKLIKHKKWDLRRATFLVENCFWEISSENVKYFWPRLYDNWTATFHYTEFQEAYSQWDFSSLLRQEAGGQEIEWAEVWCSRISSLETEWLIEIHFKFPIWSKNVASESLERQVCIFYFKKVWLYCIMRLCKLNGTRWSHATSLSWGLRTSAETHADTFTSALIETGNHSAAIH